MFYAKTKNVSKHVNMIDYTCVNSERKNIRTVSQKSNYTTSYINNLTREWTKLSMQVCCYIF